MFHTSWLNSEALCLLWCPETIQNLHTWPLKIQYFVCHLYFRTMMIFVSRFMSVTERPIKVEHKYVWHDVSSFFFYIDCCFMTKRAVKLTVQQVWVIILQGLKVISQLVKIGLGNQNLKVLRQNSRWRLSKPEILMVY